MIRKRIRRNSSLLVLALFCAAAAAAADIPRGQLLELTVHGAALEGSVLDYSRVREVNVYLPPVYVSDAERRFPVVYVLHGITDPLTAWTVPWDDDLAEYGTLQDVMDRGIAAGRLREMILVLFDARTPYYGAHYVNSPVKGNWQDFIVDDLVPFVDGHYRTLDRRESRGIMGHSMGGYGALRTALDRPDLFSAAYGLSPSLLGWSGDLSAENPAFRILASGADPAGYFDDNFYVGAILGVSQAFSPNPGRPPYFADYPFRLDGDEVVPNEPAHSRWEANFLANRIDDYLAQPVRLNGLRFDAGFDDQFTHIPATSRAFSEALQDKGVPHTFEMYNGDHRNRLWGKRGRINTEVLPYLSGLLSGD